MSNRSWWIPVTVVLAGGLAYAGQIDMGELKKMEEQSDTCKQLATKVQERSGEMREQYQNVARTLDSWKVKRGHVGDPEKKKLEQVMDDLLKATRAFDRQAKDLLECGKRLETMSDKVKKG